MEEFDIKSIREEIAKLQNTLNWYDHRKGLMPYDWVSYGHKNIRKLLELCKVGFDGHVKKKDKLGHWR